MKFLITGGCGFLGSNLAAEVLQRGQDLLVFDNLSRWGADRNLSWLRGKGEFQFLHGDVRNADDVHQAIANYRPDVIFHVAGQVAMTTSLQRPAYDFMVNALGSIHVLEAVRRCELNPTVIFSSTNKVYGDLEDLTYQDIGPRYTIKGHPSGLNEDLPVLPRTPYGCSKATADQYMQDYKKCYGLNTVVFRHSSIYGGRQFSTIDQGWIGWFVAQAVAATRQPERAISFDISGDGKQVRDVLYADDLVSCYFNALENIDNVAGEVFNIGGGIDNSLSLLELFQFLENELDIKMNYQHLPWRESDQRVFVADITKAEKGFQWTPKVSKEEGVRQMIQWTKEVGQL